MANKQLRENLSLDRVAFKERALNELKELNTCDKAGAITECLDHFIKGRKWVDNINLDEIKVMVTLSNNDDEALVESVMNQVSPRAMAKREPIAKKEDKKELKESLTRTVKESVQLNEGPGAGYSVKGSLANLSNIQILNTSSNINKYGENEITVKAKANCDLTGVEASSYYYGREIVDGAPIPATIELNFTYYENEFKGESTEQVVKYFNEFEFDCGVGGGYSHSTFTGVFDGDYNDVEKEPYGCDTTSFIITITNERVIQDIDKAVTGDDWFDNYDVVDRDGDIVDSFDTEDEAVAYAKKNGGVAVEHRQYRYALMSDFESEDIIDEYYEGTVWEREYTKSYKFDDDDMGEAFDKRDLYVNGKYVCSSNRYNSNKEFRNKVMQDRKVKYAGDRAIATSGVEMDEFDINQDDVVKVRKAKREAYDNEAKNLIRVKYNDAWYIIDEDTDEEIDGPFETLKDTEDYGYGNLEYVCPRRDESIVDEQIKYVIYKENGKYKGTPKSNYDAEVRDANMVQDFSKFDDPTRIIAYLVKYTPNKDMSTYEVVDESIKEDLEDKTTFHLTTGNTPILDAGLYYSFLGELVPSKSDEPERFKEFEDCVMENAQPILDELVKESGDFEVVSVDAYYHPKYYNYETDELEFTVKYTGDELGTVIETYSNNDDFIDFLKNYSSYDGFFSNFADNREDFIAQDYGKSVAQILKYNVSQEEYEHANEELYYDVMDCGFYPEDEEDIDESFRECDNVPKQEEVKEPVKEGYYDYLDRDYADLLDSNIDVYDVKQYVLDDTDNKFRTHYTDKYAIYVCANGKGCVVDYEAVGQDFDSVNDKISFGVEENKDNEYVDEQGNKHRTINLMATHRLNTTPKEIIEKAPKETMKFRDFFRKYKYNDRCASNFKSLAEYIKKNDDLSKYHKVLDDNDEKNA